MKLPFLSARNYLRLRTTDTDDENNKDIPESRSRIRVILSGIGCFIAGALALEGVRIVGALSRAPPPTLERESTPSAPLA